MYGVATPALITKQTVLQCTENYTRPIVYCQSVISSNSLWVVGNYVDMKPESVGTPFGIALELFCY